jgi:hypothetical protein
MNGISINGPEKTIWIPAFAGMTDPGLYIMEVGKIKVL